MKRVLRLITGEQREIVCDISPAEIKGTLIHPLNSRNEILEGELDNYDISQEDLLLAFLTGFAEITKDQFSKWDASRDTSPIGIISSKKTAPLNLSEDEMKKVATETMNFVLDHMLTRDSKPIVTIGDPAALRSNFCEPMPAKGTDFDNILLELENNVFAHMQNENHPRYFDYVPAAPNFISILSDFISAAVNPFASSVAEGSGPRALELQVIEWMRSLVGFPEGATAIFTAGGSESNSQALLVALNNLKKRNANNDLPNSKAVVYCSDQTNSSVFKHIQAIGLTVRKITSDGNFCLSAKSLESAIASDRESGLIPCCVVSNLGTTNTGAIDPLKEIGDICKREKLWHHVDGAYGLGFALYEDSIKDLLHNSNIDSICGNGHKTLFFTQYGNSIVIFRDIDPLLETYLQGDQAAYLKDYGLAKLDSFYSSPRMTRSIREAQEIYTAIKYFGTNEFKKALKRLVTLAKYAEKIILESPSLERVTGANLSVVTFRYNPGITNNDNLNSLQDKIRDKVNESQKAVIGRTILNGNTVLRMCIINPCTTNKDIEETLKLIKDTGNKLIKNYFERS